MPCNAWGGRKSFGWQKDMTADKELPPDQLHMDLLVRQLEEKTRELERANAALRASEAALKRSQEIAHVGHWSWDIHTNRVTWSDEMCRIFGVDPAAVDSVLDEVIKRTIHPDGRERVVEANAAVRDAVRPAPTKYRVV